VSQNSWFLDAMDGFDTDAEPYRFAGPYSTEEAALAEADTYFEYLENDCPPDASDGCTFTGIQDRLYLVTPDGQRRRLYPR
jgi:hypothetical protein